MKSNAPRSRARIRSRELISGEGRGGGDWWGGCGTEREEGQEEDPHLFLSHYALLGLANIKNTPAYDRFGTSVPFLLRKWHTDVINNAMYLYSNCHRTWRYLPPFVLLFHIRIEAKISAGVFTINTDLDREQLPIFFKQSICFECKRKWGHSLCASLGSMDLMIM